MNKGSTYRYFRKSCDMKLDDQVCTPEQGKKLKELGIAQGHSLFVRVCYMPDPLGIDFYFGTQYWEMPQETLEEAIYDMFTASGINVNDALWNNNI